MKIDIETCKPGAVIQYDPRDGFPHLYRKPGPQQFSMLTTGAGVVICEKYDGAKLVLKCAEDVENLRALLAQIDVARLPDQPKGDQ
jgi:hypothetical protein